MSYVLTLIASDIALSIAHLERLEALVESCGIGLAGKPVWLDVHVATDLPIQNCVTLDQMKMLRAMFADEHIDIICTPQAGRVKKLLLADMDSTIVTSETLDELADRAGIKDKIAAITARAMNGELDFHAALRERVGLLKGLPVAALQETLNDTYMSKDADIMVRAMTAYGAKCVLVSGGFTFFTEAVADRAGFHHHHGNTLDHNDVVLSGTVSGRILDKDAKLAFLHNYAADLGIELSETVAIGDGANDLPMLLAAGLGIGYRPKPVLEETLLNILRYTSLKGVLYAQGYRHLAD